MNQNFNALRRLFYLRLLDPFSVLLAPYFLFLLVSFLTLDFSWLGLALGVVVAYIVLERAAQSGHPALWARQLTPNFYAVRSWNGRWSIFQRPPRQQDCRSMLQELIKEQSRLPAALSLYPGIYQAITHDTVLRRLQRMEHARILQVRPVYTASMEMIYSHMTRGRCRKCKCPCQFYRMATSFRVFYLVNFQIG